MPKRRKKKPKAKKHYGEGLNGFPELGIREGAEVTLRIDSKLLAAAESEDPKTTQKGSGGGTAENRLDRGQPGRGSVAHPLRGQREHAQRRLGCEQRHSHSRVAGLPQPIALRTGGRAWPAAYGFTTPRPGC